MDNIEKLITISCRKLKLKNASALCRALSINPSYMSRLRNKKMTMTASALISFHDATGISIEELKALSGYSSGFTRAKTGGPIV